MDENPTSPIRVLVVEGGESDSGPVGDALASDGDGRLEIARAASVADALPMLEHFMQTARDGGPVEIQR